VPPEKPLFQLETEEKEIRARWFGKGYFVGRGRRSRLKGFAKEKKSSHAESRATGGMLA